jgi:hypothetical protein
MPHSELLRYNNFLGVLFSYFEGSDVPKAKVARRTQYRRRFFRKLLESAGKKSDEEHRHHGNSGREPSSSPTISMMTKDKTRNNAKTIHHQTTLAFGCRRASQSNRSMILPSISDPIEAQ